MGKKLAIMFPGIGYSVDRPLLYYSKKILEANGYEIVCVNYEELHGETIFEAGTRLLSRDKLLTFVAKAKELVMSQLQKIDYTKYDKLIFVSKSIGAVIGAIYAMQKGISPYHLMITPLEYAFQFVEEGSGSAFCGSADDLADCEALRSMCQEKVFDFHLFKDCNHSLETKDVERNLEHLKRYVSVIGNIISDMDKSIYDFEILGRKQQSIPMSQYKGKVLLIVNTATGCGFTPQYKGLEDLYKKYQKQGFEILDFPCNQFANQAPGTEAEIYSFCTSRYEISFDQFAKICVNGEKESELFSFLKKRKGFKGFDMSKPESVYLVHKLEKECPRYELSNDIKWNFTKFLVDQNGHVIERFEPTTDMSLVEDAISQLL